MKHVELGCTVVDRITGISGVVVGKTTWLTGCMTVGIQPRAKDDAKMPDAVWVDEERCEVKEGVPLVLVKNQAISDPGGPQPTPGTGRSTPKRTD